MAAFWQILPHTSACLAGNRVFLLDIRQDRYFVVPPTIEGIVKDWLTCSSASAAPTSLLDVLRKAGALRAGDPPPINRRRIVSVPVTLEREQVKAPMSLGVVAKTWQLTLSTSLALRRRSLIALLVPPESSKVIPQDLYLQTNIAQSFDAARSMFPVPRRCLLDSLALRRWLEQAGQHASLIFGIKEAPFSAHCWLQNDAAILNDHFDQVSRFTPILSA